MGEREDREEKLRKIIASAETIRAELAHLLASGKNVHFRPASKGFSMVGLLHDKPQLGKSGLTDAKKTAAEFERLFALHCDGDAPGRKTPEKALQSFLIRDAYAHERHMAALEHASKGTNDPIELVFVTDEIPLPFNSKKIVCDLLALRVDGGVSTPVLIELKSDRMLKRLLEQVEGYAGVIDEHADLFAQLFAATLAREVRFDGPTERWIVWPAPGGDLARVDEREATLRARGVRVVGYAEPNEGSHDFRFRVGER